MFPNIKNSRYLIRKSFCFILSILFILSMNTFDSFADTSTPSSSTAVAKKPTALKSKVTEGYITLTWKTKYEHSEIEIYRSVGNKSSYKLYDTISCDSMKCTYIDYDVAAKKAYYYKIRIIGYSMTSIDATTGESVSVNVDGISKFKATKKVKVKAEKVKLASVKSYNTGKINVTWKRAKKASGYEIYRSDSANGMYTLIKTLRGNAKSSYTYSDKDIISGYDYYYMIKPYTIKRYKKTYGAASNIKHATAKLLKADLSSNTSDAEGTNTIVWNKIEGATSYEVFFSLEEKGTYVKLATLLPTDVVTIKADNATGSTGTEQTPEEKLVYKHTGLTNGTSYYYKVTAYKEVNNKTIKSTSNVFKKVCDYYAFKGETKKQKAQRIFGKDDYVRYSSANEARSHMTTFNIKVWDMKKTGKKYSRTFSLTVNKNIAPSVKKMFKEIYASGEKIPIHAIGGYSWRGSRSEHNEGLAIDINPDENYMIDNGKILAGSYWNPKKSEYSIPLECQMVTIMENYGFTRGFWNNRKDYMHFSYFGT